MGALKEALIGTASYLPPVNNVFNQWRSFAHAKLPFCGLKNVCAISPDKGAKVLRVLVASADGFLYVYDLNVGDGGECTLIKQHKLEDGVADSAPEAGFSAAAAGEASPPQPLVVSYAGAVRGPETASQPLGRRLTAAALPTGAAALHSGPRSDLLDEDSAGGHSPNSSF